MDYFKVKSTLKKKDKRTEEEVRISLEEHVAKEYPDYIVLKWDWDEEAREGILQMRSK